MTPKIALLSIVLHLMRPSTSCAKDLYKDTRGIPHLATCNAHTNCYPDPLSKVNDAIQIDLENVKVTDFTGNLYVVT